MLNNLFSDHNGPLYQWLINPDAPIPPIASELLNSTIQYQVSLTLGLSFLFVLSFLITLIATIRGFRARWDDYAIYVDYYLIVITIAGLMALTTGIVGFRYGVASYVSINYPRSTVVKALPLPPITNNFYSYSDVQIEPPTSETPHE